MACPQCGQPLEPYQPADEHALESELAGEAETGSSLIGEAVPAPVNLAIVSTHAFEGLSAAVREQLQARQVSLSSEISQARPTAAVPTPAPADVLPQPPADDKSSHATRILDINDERDKIEAMVAQAQAEAQAEAEAVPSPTMALDTAEPPAPTVPAPTAAAGGEVRFGSPRSSGRHTRIEGIALLDPPAEPAVSPLETPPAVQRVDPPLALTPIGPPEPAAAPAKARLTPPIAAPVPASRTQPPRATTPPPRAPSGSGAGLKVVGVIVGALLLGAAGAAAWHFTREKPVAPPPEVPPSAAPAADTFDKKLDAALADGQAELPRASAGEALKESAFLAAGPEGLTTSFGAVPGLPAVTIPDPQVERVAGGELVKPLKALLAANAGGNPGRLLLAVDTHVTARTILRLAFSGFDAGFRQFGLVVERGSAGPGVLPFTMLPAQAPLPPEGAVLISVGTISVKADAHDAAGAMLSDGVAVPHKEPGSKVDLDAVVARLLVLGKTHVGVKRAILYPNLEMNLEQLVSVVERISGDGSRPLFSEVSLGVR